MRLLQPLRLLPLHRHSHSRLLPPPRHDLLERCLQYLRPLPRLYLKLLPRLRVLQLPLHLRPLLPLRRLPQWQMLLARLLLR